MECEYKASVPESIREYNHGGRPRTEATNALVAFIGKKDASYCQLTFDSVDEALLAVSTMCAYVRRHKADVRVSRRGSIVHLVKDGDDA